MENKNQENKPEDNKEKKASSEEKATFDSNGKGESEKFGQAGSTPNESGEEDGVGTVNKDTK
ncbi:hypothetical protein [Pedobacter mucosus]|uniref:hypothetical protein n=1 Tax=Pedobacter mucosus TaxID=2895286 RepID=UPI001EE3B691|nr:hypothetical protein [Pedobacter mucosus]UKT65787.1 hypothetical protein LOK61_08345 [Pedobacter mucosus]